MRDWEPRRVSSTGSETVCELAIVVNGEPMRVGAETLGALVTALGLGGKRVATALNGDFVPERARDGMRLKSGDRVEIVSARQGG